MVIATCVFMLAICLTLPVRAGEVHLNLSHFFPAGHPVEEVLVQEWIAAVDEATDGRVQVTSYPGETLIGADETYSGIVSGIADIGISVFAYTRGRFPVLEVFELPGIPYPNSRVASLVAWEGIKEFEPEEVQDTELMMVLATGPGDLMTTEPVRGLSDLEGMEIRATGLSARTLEDLGATPVAMSQPETYEALSRGIVQGNLSPPEVLMGWQHGEVTDYITLTPFLYNTLFFMTMNRETWDSLSPEVREAIREVNEDVHYRVAAGLWDDQNREALDWAVEDMGLEVIELSEDEVEEWIARVLPIQDDFVQRMEEEGYPGGEILERVLELADEFGARYGDEH